MHLQCYQINYDVTNDNLIAKVAIISSSQVHEGRSPTVSLKLIGGLAVHLSVRAEATGVLELVLAPVLHSWIKCLDGVRSNGLVVDSQVDSISALVKRVGS